MQELNPTVFIGSLEWREPITTLTDFLVGLVGFYAFYRLQTYKGEKRENFNFYKFYFLCFAIGMTSAAWFGHALQAYVGPRMKIIGWCMSATGFLCLGWATLIEVKPLIPKWLLSTFKAWMLIEYLLVVGLMIHPDYSNFMIPQINSTVFLIFLILPMHFFNYWRTKSAGSFWIACTIVYGIVPGIAYNTQFSLSRWFNYHDISHCLMAVFMILMFFGIRRITGMEAYEAQAESSFGKMA